MPRNKCKRHISNLPGVTYYKPAGIPLGQMSEVLVTYDELEAIKLADLENNYQKEAAIKMNISRQTFGRIIESAHSKIADALLNGKAIKIEGGNIEIKNS